MAKNLEGRCFSAGSALDCMNSWHLVFRNIFDIPDVWAFSMQDLIFVVLLVPHNFEDIELRPFEVTARAAMHSPWCFLTAAKSSQATDTRIRYQYAFQWRPLRSSQPAGTKTVLCVF